MSQLKSRIFVTKGCLSNRERAEEAPKFAPAVDLTLSSGAISPSMGGLLRSGRIALRLCRASISSMIRRRPDHQRPSRKQPSASHGCGRTLTAYDQDHLEWRIPRRRRQSGMTFPSIVIPLWLFVEHDLFGKPVPTHRVVAPRACFPDHPRVQPPMDLTFNIELRPGWR